MTSGAFDPAELAREPPPFKVGDIVIADVPCEHCANIRDGAPYVGISHPLLSRVVDLGNYTLVVELLEVGGDHGILVPGRKVPVNAFWAQYADPITRLAWLTR